MATTTQAIAAVMRGQKAVQEMERSRTCCGTSLRAGTESRLNLLRACFLNMEDRLSVLHVNRVQMRLVVDADTFKCLQAMDVWTLGEFLEADVDRLERALSSMKPYERHAVLSMHPDYDQEVCQCK